MTEPIEPLLQLRQQYLALVNRQLPQRAKQGGMPVRFNHCFARIILDNLFQDCWYNHLSRKMPAYKQLNGEQLKEAISIANRMLIDTESAIALNNNSLRWRGKMER